MTLRASHRLTAALGAALFVTTSMWVGTNAANAAPVPDTALTPTEPARILETRSGAANTTVDGLFEGIGRAAAGSTIALQVAGRGGVPDDAEAVMLNLAAVFPDAPGYLQAYPCGTAQPVASNVNYLAGQVVANSVLAKIGTGGTVCVFTLAATHVIADVNGYVPAGGSLSAVGPARLADSRTGPGATTIDGLFEGFGRTAPGSTTEVQVAGRGGVPADADSVVLNVTAILPDDPGNLVVYACDAPRPEASTINYQPGLVVANLALTGLSATGTVCVYTLTDTDLTIDVNGFVPAGGSLPAVGPARVLETRTGPTTIDGLFEGIGKPAAGDVIELQVAGRAGVPLDAEAVLLNLAAIFPDAPGYLEVYPCGTTRPNASNVNYLPGQVVANAVLAKIGTGGTVCVYTLAPVDIVADVTGYVPAAIMPGTIVVEKQTLPDRDPQTFDFTGDIAGSTADDGTLTLAGLAPGTYTSTESALAGWDLTDITCDDAGSATPSTTAGSTATFELDEGETITCVFTNTKRGSVTIVKDAVPDDTQDYSFTGDLGAFTLDDDADPTLSNTVTFTDVEPGTYDVTESDPAPTVLTGVSCDDGGSATPSTTSGPTATVEVDPGESVTCTFVNTGNAAPVIASDGGGDTAAVDAQENQTAVTDVDTTDDADSEGAGLTYSFTTDAGGGTDNAAFSIDGSTGVLTFQAAPDFENPADSDTDNDYEVQVTVTDSGPGTVRSDTQDITVSVVPVNEPPVLSAPVAGSVPENIIFLVNIDSSDPEGETENGGGLTYSLSGDDAGLFSIDATGDLAFLSGPDFENPGDTGGNNVYEFTITVTDSGLLTDDQPLTITVNNVNEAPSITSDGGGGSAPLNIDENTTAVTDVESSDPEGETESGGGLTYSLSGDDAGLFSIDAAGNLSFDTPPDFENPGDADTDNDYLVTVTVTDSGTLTGTQDLTVTVDDVVIEAVPPTAVDDAYAATGNVSMSVPSGAGVILGTGADDDGGGTLTVTEVQGVGANVGVATATDATGLGGITGFVTVAADGSFAYEPPPGYVGDDTFTYEITNAAGSDTATVTITVSDMIWFVDSSSTGSNRGTLSDPFTTVTSLNGAQGPASPSPTDGQTIFVATGTGTYLDGIILRTGQKLVGEGATVPITIAASIALAPFSDALPTTSGTAPVLADAAGAGVSLSSNNLVRGIDIGNTSGPGLASSAVAGTLAVSEVAISGTGGGVDIFGSGSDPISVVLTDLSSSSSTEHGIQLQSVGGSLDVTGTSGTISTTNLAAVDVDTSSTDVTYNGAIVAANTTANGIDLTGNPGATITLGGSIDIDTTTGIGLNATGGGTIGIPGVTNTIVTTTGIGVNIVNTTIGGAGPSVSGTDLTGTFGVNFLSVSVGTGASGPTSGIVLDNAGGGGFTITGTGANGTGGTLQDTTGDAIILRNGTANVELTNIVLDDIGRHGVSGVGVTNLVVNNSQFTDIGNAIDETAFSFDTDTGAQDNNVAGQLTLNNVDVTRFFDNGLNIFAESGSVNVDVINGSDFLDNADTASKGQAIIVETEGTAGVDLNVNGSLFDNVETDAVRLEAGGSGTNNADVIGNTITNPGGPDNFPNGGSFHMIVTDAATLSFDIQGNTQNDLPGDGIIVAASTGGGNISGRIGGPNPADGNIINGGVDSGGFPVTDGIFVSDIGVDATIAETMTLLIQNNTINANNGDDGIQFSVGDNNGTYNVTIDDNTISNTTSEGIRFFFDDDAFQSPTLNLDVGNNSFTAIGDGAIELATREAGIACANFTGNDNGAGGSPGTIRLDERDISAISITQASTAALSAANNGATVSVDTNPVAFNATCGTTLPSHP